MVAVAVVLFCHNYVQTLPHLFTRPKLLLLLQLLFLLLRYFCSNYEQTLPHLLRRPMRVKHFVGYSSSFIDITCAAIKSDLDRDKF